MLCHTSIWIFREGRRGSAVENAALAAFTNGFAQLGLFTVISGFVSEHRVAGEEVACSLGAVLGTYCNPRQPQQAAVLLFLRLQGV